MSDNTRHFGRFTPNGEEVIIIGYNAKMNDLMVAFPSAMPVQDANDLRGIALSADAQGKDYLLDPDPNKSVLSKAHHKGTNTDWQSFLIRTMVAKRGGTVRSVAVKDVEFANRDQKAFFQGYGESIDPDAEAERQHRRNYAEAMRNGTPLPETPSKLGTGGQVEQPMAAPAAPAVDPNAALVEALGAIAAGQAAILEKLDNVAKPARKAPAKRKAPARKKAAPKKAAEPAVEVETAPVVETPVVADDHSMTASAYGGTE